MKGGVREKGLDTYPVELLARYGAHGVRTGLLDVLKDNLASWNTGKGGERGETAVGGGGAKFAAGVIDDPLS